MPYKPVRVRFPGLATGPEVAAVPESKQPDGTWFLRSMVRHPRFDVGHLFQAPETDIVDPIEEYT